METKQAAQAPEIKVHVFERAGLGKAPYTFKGAGREIFQAIPGDPSCPIQPGTSCDYCGQGIMDVFHLASADGRRFKVGSDCINRAGDRGLKRAIAPAIRKAQHARDDARVAKAAAELDGVREALRAQPHPYLFMAAKGSTLLDFVEWNLGHAGRSGKVKAARAIEIVSKAAAALAEVSK
jgi:hypothetical protein